MRHIHYLFLILLIPAIQSFADEAPFAIPEEYYLTFTEFPFVVNILANDFDLDGDLISIGNISGDCEFELIDNILVIYSPPFYLSESQPNFEIIYEVCDNSPSQFCTPSFASFIIYDLIQPEFPFEEECHCEWDDAIHVCTDSGEIFPSACIAECLGITNYSECTDLPPFFGDSFPDYPDNPDTPSNPEDPPFDLECEIDFEGSFCSFSGETYLTICEAFESGAFDILPCSEFESGFEDDPLFCDLLPVWPGDINFDGIVNNFDLLEIGTYFNTVGLPRPVISNDWYEHFSVCWGDSTFFGVDLKHVDANGDGWISNADVSVIEQNYGFTHANSFANSIDSASVPQIHLDVSKDLFFEEIIEIPIYLGTIGNPVENFTGVAFSIDYNPELIIEESIAIEFTNESWIGEPDQIISLAHNIDQHSVLEAAVSPINFTGPISGYGEIAKLTFVMEENLAGKNELQQILLPFTIRSFYKQNDPSYIGTQSNEHITVNTAKKDLLVEEPINFGLSPNPASQFVNINWLGTEVTQSGLLFIYNFRGEIVLESKLELPFQSLNLTSEIEALNPGLYVVNIRSTHGANHSEKLLIK